MLILKYTLGSGDTETFLIPNDKLEDTITGVINDGYCFVYMKTPLYEVISDVLVNPVMTVTESKPSTLAELLNHNILYLMNDTPGYDLIDLEETAEEFTGVKRHIFHVDTT